MIPESAPYVRRDPRYYYCARLPGEGGAVYRLTRSDGTIERMDMINEALPEHFYTVQSRSALRGRLDQRFAEAGIPDLETFVRESILAVERWGQEQESQP